MRFHPVPPHIPFMKTLENQRYHQDFPATSAARGSGSSFKLFLQQITHSLKIAVAFVKIYNFKTPTLCMVSRLRTPNLRAECWKLLHFIKQKRHAVCNKGIVFSLWNSDRIVFGISG